VFLAHLTGAPAHLPRLDSVTAFRAMAQLYHRAGSHQD
jgi:hypothetical protein